MSHFRLGSGWANRLFKGEARSGYAGLALILLLKLIWQLFLLQQGFISTSGDDFLRALIAYEWSKSPFFAATEFGFAAVLWLPQHFWLVGSGLRLYPDLWLVPLVVSLCFSLASLMVLYLTTSSLFAPRVGLLAVLLAAFLPWQVWLTISGIAATLFHFLLLSGIYLTLAWQASGKFRTLILAAATFLLLTMVRPEGWLYAGLFSLFGLLTLYRTRTVPTTRWPLILAILLPGCFMLYWLYFNYITYGNALQFIKFSREAYQAEVSNVDSLLVRFLNYPVLMFIVSPWLLLLLIPALLHAFTRRQLNLNTYLYFFAGGLTLLMFLSLIGTGTNTAPQRYVVPSLILSTPLTAGWLYRITRRARWSLGAGLLLFISYNLTMSLIGFPREYRDVAELGRFLRRQWETGALTPADRVASEKSFRAYVSNEPPDYLAEVFLITDHWALQVMSNHPEAFAKTHWDPKPVVASTEYPDLPTYLEQEQVKIIIVKDRALLEHIPAGYTLANIIGGYLLFSRQPEPLPTLPIAATPPMQTVWPVAYDDRLSLVGYSLDDSFLPKHITLFWRLREQTGEFDRSSCGTAMRMKIRPYAPPPSRGRLGGGLFSREAYRMQLQLVNAQDETIRYLTDFQPYYERYPPATWPPGQVVAERLEFPRPLDFVPGAYWVKIKLLAPARLGAIEPDQELVLGPFMMSATKRGVFKYFLQERKVDFALLLKVMAAL
jgi:hypothetical protein